MIQQRRQRHSPFSRVSWAERAVFKRAGVVAPTHVFLLIIEAIPVGRTLVIATSGRLMVSQGRERSPYHQKAAFYRSRAKIRIIVCHSEPAFFEFCYGLVASPLSERRMHAQLSVCLTRGSRLAGKSAPRHPRTRIRRAATMPPEH